MQPLTGHTSPETAYVVEDYPYGFRLRCRMRHWLEHRPGHGFRHVTQTSNPKRPGLAWNAPKAGTYAPALVLALDEQGPVGTYGVGRFSTPDEIDAFERAFAAALTDEHRAALRYLRARHRAGQRVTWTATSGHDAGPRQSLDEQAAILRALTRDELRRDPTAA